MQLPYYSIIQKIKFDDNVSKTIAGVLAVGALFFNRPSSFQELILGIGKGMLIDIPITLTELAFIYQFNKTNTGSDLLDSRWQYDFRLGAPKFSSLIEEDIDAVTKAPIDEEFISRGLLLPLVKTILMTMTFSEINSSYLAILTSALIFALQHDPDERSQLAAFIGGLEYGLMREKYGLFSSIAAHFTGNFIIGIADVVPTYIYRKIQQIKAVHEDHQPYVLTEKEVIDENFKSRNTYQLYRDNLKLENENRQLKEIVKIDYANNHSFLFSSTYPSHKKIKKQHQQLLLENEKLRKDAQDELSKSYIYKLLRFC